MATRRMPTTIEELDRMQSHINGRKFKPSVCAGALITATPHREIMDVWDGGYRIGTVRWVEHGWMPIWGRGRRAL